MIDVDPIFDTGLTKQCEKCKRWKTAKSPFVERYGKGKEGILIVVDTMTQEDDKKGKVLQGESQKELSLMLRRMGYSLERDFWITAGIKCYGKKEPSKTCAVNCRKRLFDEIEELKPKAVIVMGSKALDVMCGAQLDKSSITAIAGAHIPFKDTMVYPLFSPKTLVKNKYDENLKSYFRKSLKRALDHIKDLDEYPEIPDPIEWVECLTEFNEVEKLFKMLATYDGATAFDFETSGVKPYHKGHKIYSMSIALEDAVAYAFPVEYPGHWTKDQIKRIKAMIRGYLQNNVYKVAHNSQFERMWSRHLLGVVPHIDWCTMTMNHLVDTRKGRNSLKLQAFLRWGVYGYDDESKKYIEAPEGEEFNNMDKMPLPEQLYYVGGDAHLTMRLFLEQEEELGYNQKGARFFNMGLMAMEELTANGIVCDIDWYNEKEKELSKEIKNLEEELYESQEVLKYINDYALEKWEYTSTQQLREFLVNGLGFTSDKETEGGSMSTDNESLTKMNHWIPDQIIKLRKLLKLRDTYLAQFMREVVEGKLHPDFTLHVARSLRSSSRNPNFQNLPKRDDEAKRLIRSGLLPSPGRRLVEVDFSGIEVSTSVLYHKDPVFLNYLVDDDADMHRDNAADIWMTDGDNVSKKVRFYAKNCWTFPQFYGDYYASCAKALWENRNEKLKNGIKCVDNLKMKGVTTYKKFVKHLKKCEDILWNKRFKVYTAWKNKINKQYQRDGYIETYFGFRYTGYLDKKQATNYPIQGTAFHILLWCLIRILAIAKKQGWKTKIIGQIHDSMILDLVPEEEEMVLNTIRRVCERDVVDRFDWITTQFRIDVEMSEIDGTFADLEEYHFAEAA